jgi:hypothetical protein
VAGGYEAKPHHPLSVLHVTRVPSGMGPGSRSSVCGNTASRELILAKPSLHAVVRLPREAAQQRVAAADEAWREANPRRRSFEPLWPGVPSVANRGGHS